MPRLPAQLALTLAAAALSATALHAIPPGPPPTALPSLPQYTDDKLEPEMKKLIAWVNTGSKEQRQLAALAIRMSPAAAYPLFEEAAKDPNLSKEVKDFYTTVMSNLRKARAAREKAIADDNKWIESARAVYLKSDKRDPKLDTDAGALFTGISAQPGYPNIADPYLLAGPIARVAESNPRDPLLRFLSLTGTIPPARRLTIANDILQSNYPPSWKLHVAVWALDPTFRKGDRTIWDPTILTGIKALITASAEQLIPLDNEPVPEFRAYNVLTLLGTAIARADGYDAAWKQIEPHAAKLLKNPAHSLAIQASIHRNLAQDLRGTGFTNTVTPEDWQTVQAHFAASRELLQKAYDLDPTDCLAPRIMMAILLHTGSPDERDTWFRRALETNPDNPNILDDAVWARMSRWGGGGEPAMQEIAHASALSRNYAGHIPQQSLTLWRTIARSETPLENYNQKFKERFAQPEYAIDARFVYDEAVRLCPDNYTLATAFRAYVFANDGPRIKATFLRLPDDFNAADVWGENWKATKDRLKSTDSHPPNPAPEGVRPAWAP